MKKKAEVVGKTDYKNEQAPKEKTENKNMTVDKDENIENINYRETKAEDELYGKPNQQCQNHHKITVAETKTKEEKKKPGREKIYGQRRLKQRKQQQSKLSRGKTFEIMSENFRRQRIEIQSERTPTSNKRATAKRI